MVGFEPCPLLSEETSLPTVPEALTNIPVNLTLLMSKYLMSKMKIAKKLVVTEKCLYKCSNKGLNPGRGKIKSTCRKLKQVIGNLFSQQRSMCHVHVNETLLFSFVNRNHPRGIRRLVDGCNLFSQMILPVKIHQGPILCRNFPLKSMLC